MGTNDLRGQIAFLEDEITSLRRRLQGKSEETQAVELRLTETQNTLSSVVNQNERLATTLREAADQIVALKEEVDRLAMPPNGYGIFLRNLQDGTVDIFTGGRELRVNSTPSIDPENLRVGQEVVLNEALNVVGARGYAGLGDLVTLLDVLPEGDRAIIQTAGDDRLVLLGENIRSSDLLLEISYLSILDQGLPWNHSRPTSNPFHLARSPMQAGIKLVEWIKKWSSSKSSRRDRCATLGD
ncbi:hypothetical protein QA942_23120 [Streptomyces sp. B21-106]|uniref:hypothetical protein n=1 Tax=Streptomyces sp. B21-106 TaxID=3039418 RepID=UPI002FF2141D